MERLTKIWLFVLSMIVAAGLLNEFYDAGYDAGYYDALDEENVYSCPLYEV